MFFDDRFKFSSAAELSQCLDARLDSFLALLGYPKFPLTPDCIAEESAFLGVGNLTLLFVSFTFSRSFTIMNRFTSSITRSPAFLRLHIDVAVVRMPTESMSFVVQPLGVRLDSGGIRNLIPRIPSLKTGLKTCAIACCTIRSLTVGIPNCRVPPFGLVVCTPNNVSCPAYVDTERASRPFY
jgi:hypothetical protein